MGENGCNIYKISKFCNWDFFLPFYYIYFFSFLKMYICYKQLQGEKKKLSIKKKKKLQIIQNLESTRAFYFEWYLGILALAFVIHFKHIDP